MDVCRRAFTARLIAGAAAAPLAAAAGGLAFGGVAAASDSAVAPLTVVATIGMLADAARRIGGDAADVQALMGPGVDPHAYRQTRSDIAAMSRADLTLAHGLFLEAQMEDFLGELAQSRRVVAIGDALPTSMLIAHPDYAGKFDPHVWMNPALWSQAVLGVRDALIAVRPQSRAAFDANAAAYLQELEAVTVYATTVLASVPVARRVLISAHDAFSYFGLAYGFDVVGVQGVSTESEAGLRRIEELVDLIVSRRIGAVFVESSVSDRNMRALIEGAAAQGHEVAIGGELFSDAMGPAGTYEGTYLGMIDHNATTVARALGGQAPARGRLGALVQS